MLDLIVFVPPGMSLALMATWSAHSFAPDRFTWRRGLFAALVGAATGTRTASPRALDQDESA